MQHVSTFSADSILDAQRAPGFLEDVQPMQRVTLAQIDAGWHPSVAQAVRTIRDWQRLKRRKADASMIICGSNGIGKTHMARAMWWSFSYVATDLDGNAIPGTERPEALWYSADLLMSKLGQTRDPDTGLIVSADAASVIGRKPLVVIDDVGAEGAIPFVGKDDQAGEKQARYFKAVDWCYGRVSVVITSNLSIDALRQHVGRRVWDRLMEMAPRGYVLDLGNVPSYRQRLGGR